MKKLKKILFPFFKKERHDFLKKKWWFRLGVVSYIIFLVLLPVQILSFSADSRWGWCYGNLYLYHDDYELWSEEIEYCRELVVESRLNMISDTMLGTIFIHYLFQLVLFKVVINYIILGGKK